MKNIASISNVTAVALIALMMAACGSDGTASDVENVAPSGAGTTVSAGQAGSGAVSGAPQTTKPGNGGNAVVVTGGKGATTATGKGGKGGAGGKAPVAGKGGKAGKAGAAGNAGTSTGDAGQAAPYVCPATSTLETGDTNSSMEIAGMNRTYIVHVPAKYDGKTPMPLLFDWHPMIFGTAAGQRTSSGYASKGDTEGFITVFPQGINNAWNMGPCCTQSRDVQDFEFALAMVEKIKSQACIDVKRIYSVGYSNGGGMSHYLACKHADVFAAVSPAAFDLFEEVECKPSRPITVISFRGTADNIVYYNAHESVPPTGYPLDPIHFLGAEGTFEKWAELNGCTGEPVDNVAGSGCQTYTQCKEGVEVTLCTAVGGAHFGGDPNVAWPMLAKHPMP